MLEQITNDPLYNLEGPVLRPSEEEVPLVLEIMNRFEASLLSSPAPVRAFTRFYVGCSFEEVVWGGNGYGERANTPSHALVCIDFSEVGCDRIMDVTPAEVCTLMFRGPNRKDIVSPLILALLWERERIRTGGLDPAHIECVRDNLAMVVEGVRDCCRIIQIEE